AMRLGNTCRVYGLDPWDAAVARIKTKIRLYGINNVEIITGAAENIPFEDNFFDLLISNNGINNVQDIDKTLAECCRVARSGAQFIVALNLPETMNEFYSVFEVTLKEQGLADEISKMKAHIYSKRKPLAEIEKLLKAHNFNIERIVRDSFMYRFSDGTAMLNHFLIRLAFLGSWLDVVPDSNRKEIFDKIEYKLNLIARQAGECCLSIPFVVLDCSHRMK
ncbi:MAG: arsenite methyltransferase, partial [Bacteroidota bacterium]|nr:arsenite methyltransferase [Bacteroidota bacterium]